MSPILHLGVCCNLNASTIVLRIHIWIVSSNCQKRRMHASFNLLCIADKNKLLSFSVIVSASYGELTALSRSLPVGFREGGEGKGKVSPTVI